MFDWRKLLGRLGNPKDHSESPEEIARSIDLATTDIVTERERVRNEREAALKAARGLLDRLANKDQIDPLIAALMRRLSATDTRIDLSKIIPDPCDDRGRDFFLLTLNGDGLYGVRYLFNDIEGHYHERGKVPDLKPEHVMASGLTAEALEEDLRQRALKLSRALEKKAAQSEPPAAESGRPAPVDDSDPWPSRKVPG